MNEQHEHEFPDELLSAYLDGELSPAEKARVEEQLMDSPEHRRLFEELKSLRRSLQSLPAEKLGDDFAARVLRRAERELLAEAPPSEKSPAKEPVADAAADAGPTLAPADRGVRRGLIWSIVATAAAVGLVVFGPLLNENPRNVSVRGPLTEQPQLESTNKTAPPADATLAKKSGAAEAGDAEAGKAEMAAPAKAAQDKPVVANRANEVSPAAAPLRDGDAFAAPAPPEEAKEAADLRAPTNSLQERAPQVSAQASAPQDRAPQGDAMGRGGISAGAQPNAKDRAVAGEKYQQAPEKGAAEKGATDKIAATDALHKSNSVAPPAARAGKPFDGEAAAATATVVQTGRSELQMAAAAPDVSLIRLDVTPAALSSGFFDKLLERHAITVEVASREQFGDARRFGNADDVGDADDVDDADEVDDAAVLADEPAPASRTLGSEDRRDADVADLQRELLKQKADSSQGAVDVMYVEASPAQIEGLLRDLRSQRGDVLAMALDDGGLQQQRGQFVFDSAEGRRGEEARSLDQLAEAVTSRPFGGVAPTAELEATTADAEAVADAKADENGVTREAQLNRRTANGFARRVSLPAPEVARVEARLRRATSAAQPLAAAAQGGAAGAGTISTPEADDGIAAKITANSTAPAEAANNAAPAEAAPVATGEGGIGAAPAPAPTVPPALAAPLAGDLLDQGGGADRGKMLKAKEQPLVRVLFVLRAQTSAASGAAAAEPVESPAGEAKPAGPQP